MLEKYISSLLVPYLCQYAENVDPKQLNISLWNGSASLSDLVLKPSLIEALDMPLALQRGVCKHIHFDIPIKNINSKPLEAKISQLLICLTSTMRKPYSRPAERETEKRVKEDLLQRFEDERKRKAAEKGPSDEKHSSDSGGVASRLAERVINNVIVNIDSVHIRIEDPEGRTVVGVVLRDVQLVTTGEDGEAAFIDPTNLTILHKQCKFRGLESYCECEDEEDDESNGGPRFGGGAPGSRAPASSTTFLSHEKDIKKWESAMIARTAANANGEAALASTVFGPVDGLLRVALVMQQHLKQHKNRPYVDAQVELKNVVASASRDQYAAALKQVSKFSSWRALQPIVHLRPSAHVHTSLKGSQRAKALWKFVRLAMRSLRRRALHKVIRRRLSHWCASNYEQEYEALIHRGGGGASTATPTTAAAKPSQQITWFHTHMLVEDLVHSRKNVYHKMAKELKVHKEKASAELAAEQSKKKEKSRGFSLFGWGSSDSDKKKKRKPGDPADPTWEELEKEYGLDTNVSEEDYAAVMASLPKDFCWLRAHVRLPECGLRLRMRHHPGTAQGTTTTTTTSVLALRDVRLGLSAFNHTGSFAFDVSSQDLSVSHPLAAASVGHSNSNSTCIVPYIISRPAASLRGRSTATTQSEAEPLFQLKGELAPPTQRVAGTTLDADVSVKLCPLRIFLDPVVLKWAERMFAFPADLDISSLTQSAKQVANRAQLAATSGISNAIAEAKTISLLFDAAAPLLVLPTNMGHSDATALCLSFGRAKLNTVNLTDSEKAERAQRVADPKAPKELLYSTNKAELSQLYATVTTLGAALHDDDDHDRRVGGFRCIPEVHVTADVLQRLVPASAAKHRGGEGLEAFIIRATAPSLCVAASLHQVYLLSELMDTWRAGLGPADAAAVTTALPATPLRGSTIMSTMASDAVDEQQLLSTPTVAPQADALSVDPLLLSVHLQFEEWTLSLHRDNGTGGRNENLTATTSGAVVAETAPWCSLVARPLALSLRQTSRTTTVRLSATALTCATSDGVLVLGSDDTLVRVELHMADNEPTKIFAHLTPVVVCHLGTPLMQITEFILDAVHLFQSPTAEDIVAGVIGGGGGRSATTVDPEDALSTSIFVDIEGVCLTANTRNDLCARPATATAGGDGKDVPFATARVDGVQLSLNLRKQTMCIEGSVADAAMWLAPESFSAYERNEKAPLLRRTAIASSSTSAAPAERPPLARFKFYTTATPGPIFEDAAPSSRGAPRNIRNASEVGFTKHCEVDVGEITAYFDMHAVMCLLQYFTEGYFVRITQVAARPRYDGKQVPQPPPAPQTLMRLQVYIGAATLTMPITPAAGAKNSETLRATVQRMTIENALDAACAQATMTIALHGMTMTDTGGNKPLLSPSSLTVALRGTIDPSAASTSSRLIQVSSDNVRLRVTDKELVQVLTFTASNVLRMPSPAESDAIKYRTDADETSSAQVAASGSATSDNAAPAAVVVRIMMDHIGLEFFHEDGSPQHVVAIAALGVNLIPQNQQKQISWESVEILDVRDARLTDSGTLPRDAVTSSGNSGGPLFKCGTSSIELLSKDKCGAGGEILGRTLEIDIGFSIERFAFSDQWLSVYDYVVNEAVMHALAPLIAPPPPSPTLADSVASSPPPPPTQMQLVLRAESFVMPFLCTNGVELCTARINNLDVRVMNGGGEGGSGTWVGVEIQSIALTHTKSGCRVIYCSTDDQDRGAVSPRLTQLQSAASNDSRTSTGTFSAASPHLIQDEQNDILLSTKDNDSSVATATTIFHPAETSTISQMLKLELTASQGHTDIKMSLTGLNAIVAMPMVHELIDYCTNPLQPLSKIAQLGVMKEERERVARLAVESQSHLSVCLKWAQPTVVLVGDATQLADTAHNLTASLGELSTSVDIKKVPTGTAICVSAKVTGAQVARVMADVNVALSYTSSPEEETIELKLPTANLVVSRRLLEDLSWVMARNLSLSTVDAPGAAGEASEVVEATATTAAANSSINSISYPVNDATEGTPPQQQQRSRTIRFTNAEGIRMEILDVHDVKCASVAIEAIDAVVRPDGSVSSVVRGLQVRELPSGAAMIMCGSSKQTSKTATPTASTTTTSGGEESIRLHMEPNGDAEVSIAGTRTVLLPHALGSLFNLALGIQGPPPLLGRSRRGQDDALAQTTSASRGGSSARPSSEADGGSDGSTSKKRPPLFLVNLQESSVVLTRDASTPLCCITIAGATAGMCDGAVEVFVSTFRGEDLITPNTRYRHFVEPFHTASSTGTAEDTTKQLSEAQLAALRKVLVRCHYDAKEEAMTDAFYRTALSTNDWAVLESALSVQRGNDMTADKLYKAIRRTASKYTFAHVRFGSIATAAAASVDDRTAAVFQNRLFGRVSSISVVVVPTLMVAIGAAAGELMSVVSDVAQQKARELAEDRSDAAPLTQLDLLVQRPRFVLVSKPDSSDCLEIYPGEFDVATELRRHPAAASSSSSNNAEVYTVRVHSMEVLVRGERIFQNNKPLEVQYINPIPSPTSPMSDSGAGAVATAPPSVTTRGSSSSNSSALALSASAAAAAQHSARKLTFVAPQLDITIQQQQLYFLLDMGGDITAALADQNKGGNINGSGALDLGGDDADPIFATSSPTTPLVAREAAAVGAKRSVTEGDSRTRRARTPPPPSSASPTSSTVAASSAPPMDISISLHLLRVDLASVFSLKLRDAHVTHFVHGRIQRTVLDMNGLSLAHADPPPSSDATGSSTSSKGGAAGGPDQQQAPLHPTLQILHLSDVHLQRSVHQSALECNTTEQALDANVEQIAVSVTPRVVADWIACVYEPFFLRFLRTPMRPEVALLLEEQHRVVLTEDLILDEKHLLVATNRKLRTFEVDLQGHRIIIKGAPMPLITLSEGCEVLFTHGTIFVTGGYSLASFVRFGLHSAIRCADHAPVKKRMYNSLNRGRVASAPEAEEDVAETSLASPSTTSPQHVDPMQPRRAVRSTVSTTTPTTAASKKIPPSPSKAASSASSARSGAAVSDYGGAPRVALEEEEPSVALVVTIKFVFQVHLLSNACDIDFGITSNASVKFTQRTTGTVVEHQNMHCALQSLRSTDNRTLRPTQLELQVAGVEQMMLTCTLKSLEVYLNTMYVRRVLQVLNEFQQAYEGQESGTLVEVIKKDIFTHQVDLEDENGIPLRELSRQGRCRLCRDRHGALGHEGSGVLCWRCATGRRSLFAMSIDARVDVMDFVLANNHGEMLQLRGESLTFELQDNKTINAAIRVHLWNFNTAFATWEPLVEQCTGRAVVQQIEHSAQVIFDNFSYVMSHHSTKLLLSMVEDLQSTAATTTAASPVSRTPTSSAVQQQRQSSTAAPPPQKPTAQTIVILHNRFCEHFVVGEQDLALSPYGHLDLETRAPEVRLVRKATGDRMVVPVDRSAYFSFPSSDIVVQCTTVVGPDGASLTVELDLLPLHSETHAFVAIRNTLPIRIRLYGFDDAIIDPDQMMYLASSFSLRSMLHVVPVTDDDDVFGKSETNMNFSPPSLLDVLNGNIYNLTASSLKTPSTRLYLRVTRESGEPVAGAPTHVIVVEGAVQVQNALSCPIDVSFFPVNSTGNATTDSPMETVVCAPRSSARVLRAPSLDACKVSVSAQIRKAPSLPAVLFTAAAAPPRSRTLRLSASNDEILGIATTVEGNTLRISTPYAVVNHTPYALDLMDYSTAGRLASNVGVGASSKCKNYCALPPNMKTPVPALPDSEDSFFATLHYTNPTSKARFSSPVELPFHVPGVVSQAPLVDKASQQVMHFVFITWVDPSGTRVVEIAPRWMLVNRTSEPLYAAQQFTDSVVLHTVCVPPRAAVPFVVARLPPEREVEAAAAKNLPPPGLQLRIGQSEKVQPGVAFPIEEIGNFVTVACGEHHVTQPDRTLDVAVTTDDPYTYVVLEAPAVPPFVLYNRIHVPLTVRATASQRNLCAVGAHEMAPFSFDVAPPGTGGGAAAASAERTVMAIREQQQSIDIDIRGCVVVIPLRHPKHNAQPQERSLEMGPNEYLDVTVSVFVGNHGQRIVEVLPLARTSDWKSAPTPTSFFEWTLNCKALTLSVVHAQREITFGLLEDVRAHLKRNERREIFQFSVANIQFDNQSEEAPPYETALVSIRKRQDQNAVALFVERTVVQAPSVVHVDEIRFDVAPLALHLSDAMLLGILTMVQDFKATAATTSGSATWDSCPDPQSLYDNSPKAGGWMAAQMNIERIVVNPIVLRVWFVRSSDQDVFRQQLNQQPQAAALISLMVGSINDVAVTAPGMTAQNENRRVHLQIRRFTDFYVAGINRQLIGLGFQFASSLPFIGVPIRLVSDVGSGAVMFFREPIDGLTTSTKAFALGLARGSIGLVGNVLGGGFTAVSNVTSATANIARMASGTSHREHRSANTVTGLVSGVTGLVTKPMQGFAEGGAFGLLKGLGQGVVGVAASPVGGFMSDVSKATNAAADVLSDKYLPEVKRLRHVRLFHAGGAIAPFGALAQTTEYQRRPHGGYRFSDRDLLPTDGPSWRPKSREQLQADMRFPMDRWRPESYHTTLDGWKYCSRYESEDAGTRIAQGTHIRRRRWVAVVHERPPSAVAPKALFLGTQSSSTPSNSTTPRMPSSATSATPLKTEAPASTHIETNVAEAFENQRKYPIKGWSSSLLPTDRPHWSSRDGKLSAPRDSFKLADGWEWDDEWQVYCGDGTDKDGWSYAIDFVRRFGPSEGLMDYVRRRCWRRTMKRKVSTTPSFHSS